MGKFINGITTGAIIGAAIGMMVVPELDRTTRKKIQRSSKMMRNMAGDIYDNMAKRSKW